MIEDAKQKADSITKHNELKKYITPGGLTIIEANDKLVVLSDNQEGFGKVDHWLQKPCETKKQL